VKDAPLIIKLKTIEKSLRIPITVILISFIFILGIVFKAHASEVEQVKAELRDTIALYIVAVAEENGIDGERALKVAFCESSLDYLAVGDKGKSLGLWQIYQPSWPNTKEIALDRIKSTEWAMKYLAQGRWQMWSCYKIIT